MKVGIKYCGGCNPRYDRKEFINRLCENYKNITIEPINQNIGYDLIIVVCGCSSACANKDNLDGKQIITVTSLSDYKKIIKYIQDNNCS